MSLTLNLTQIAPLETTFTQLADKLRYCLRSPEAFTLKLSAEQSQFIRFNHARVRQTSSVIDGWLTLTWMQSDRSSFREIPFTGVWETDWPQLQTALEDLRQEVPQLPVDPYLVLPTGNSSSRDVHSGELLPPEAIASTLFTPVANLDFTGFYAGGVVIRAYADSAGQQHWFATESFTLDYSLFTPEGQAVKGAFAGSHWDDAAYIAKIQESKSQFALLARPKKELSRGQYRTYLAPAAVAELVGMLSWGAIGESSLQQGGSALVALRRGEKRLSPLFNLQENFESGLVPRFNDLGEVAPIALPLISQGELVNTLVNSRTAKEYDQVANGANSSETLRSPEIKPGTLDPADILSTLDTGLYLSNLHYLNWSDRPSGRITGMTRYACFWVESGEIVAPIENLRFDESLYRFWGDNLIGLTHAPEFIPEVSTYGGRALGGTWVPGQLIADFTYTL